MKRFINNKNNSGQVLVLALIFLVVIVVLTLVLFSRVAGFVLQTGTSIAREQATNLAEAGVDYAVWQFNEGGIPDTPPGVPVTVGVGQFDTDVEVVDGTTNRITSTGCIPGCINPKQKRIIKVEVTSEPMTAAFELAVHTYIDGIEVESDASITGHVYSAGEMDSCGGGSCVITGDASTSDDDLNGWVVGGTPETDIDPPIPLPDINIPHWQSLASANIIDCSTSPDCYLNGTQTATHGYTKFEGDLELQDDAQITVNGPLYITEELNLADNTKMLLDLPCSESTVVVVDGRINVKDSAQILPTSTCSPKGFIILVSNRDTAIGDFGDDAISISTDEEIFAILIAPNGLIHIKDADTIIRGAVAAESLRFENPGEIIYDDDVSLIRFPTAAGGPWRIKRGTYRFAD